MYAVGVGTWTDTLCCIFDIQIADEDAQQKNETSSFLFWSVSSNSHTEPSLAHALDHNERPTPAGQERTRGSLRMDNEFPRTNAPFSSYATPYAVHMGLHLCPQTLMNLHIVSVCAYSLKHNAKEVGWLHICLKNTNFVKASIWALKACKKKSSEKVRRRSSMELPWAIVRKSSVLSSGWQTPVFDQGWLKNLTIYPME